jgi:hypothetical protein
MLTPATSLIQGSPVLSPVRSSGAANAAAEGTPPPVNPTNGRSNDQLKLSQTSQNRNPYQGVAPSFSTVKVDRWGQGDNDSVVQILLNQGYTQQEIYGKSGNGKSLLDEVTRVNGLRNANLIRAGQDLMVPSKGTSEAADAGPVQQQPAAEAPRQEAPRVETPRVETPAVETPPIQRETQPEQNEARVNDVRVDRWGQGPNSSLGAILKNQGFDDKQIFREDSNGDSLLKKVARANGLESPDRILAGSTLKVPNSVEALGQMNVPEMPARTETAPARVETPTERTETTPPVRTESPTRVESPTRTETRPETPPVQETGGESEPTANMGMLLDGIKDGKFTRQEYQYLNARSSRYAQMRARFAHDGYSNDELTQLGQMERRYGVEFARLAASDDVQLPEFPQNSNNADLAIQIQHYHESGPIYDGYSSGSMSSETAIQRMVRQRDEARRQEVR